MDQQLISSTLNFIRLLITISDVVLFVCIGFFAQGLKWSVEKDRASIIGFAWMMATIALSVVFLWVR